MVHRAGADLADDRAGGPNLILDDGGDATMLVHKGTEFEAAGAAPDPSTGESEEFKVFLTLLNEHARARPRQVDADRRGHQRRHRGDDDRRHAALRDAEGRQAALPGDQRQRLGDEVEVRQHLRLPPLADRRDQPRDRRDDRRQGRRRPRLRRRRQGLRGVAARPGRPGQGHRDRPDLRAPGGDAGLRGRDARGRRRDRRHLHHRDRQPGRDLGRADGADEASGDRRQHRPLRQRDRHRRPRARRRASSGSGSSRRSTSGASPTATA